MILLPHLPAPTAVFDPLKGTAPRVARTAAQRLAAHEPVAAFRGSRVRRELSRAELGDSIDQSREDRQFQGRAADETTKLGGRGASSLYLAQYYAQEIDPSDRPEATFASGVSAYPSLAFDDDILLPGEDIPLAWRRTPRLDIVV